MGRKKIISYFNMYAFSFKQMSHLKTTTDLYVFCCWKKFSAISDLKDNFYYPYFESPHTHKHTNEDTHVHTRTYARTIIYIYINSKATYRNSKQSSTYFILITTINNRISCAI